MNSIFFYTYITVNVFVLHLSLSFKNVVNLSEKNPIKANEVEENSASF